MNARQKAAKLARKWRKMLTPVSKHSIQARNDLIRSVTADALRKLIHPDA